MAQGVRKEIGKLSIFLRLRLHQVTFRLVFIALASAPALAFACEHAFRYEGFGVNTPLGMRGLG